MKEKIFVLIKMFLCVWQYKAKLNHQTFARELRKLDEKTGSIQSNILHFNHTQCDPALALLASLLKLQELIVFDEIRDKIIRILNE